MALLSEADSRLTARVDRGSEAERPCAHSRCRAAFTANTEVKKSSDPLKATPTDGGKKEKLLPFTTQKKRIDKSTTILFSSDIAFQVVGVSILEYFFFRCYDSFGP